MAELRKTTRDALLTVATSTLTGALFKRGLRNMFLQDVSPLRLTQPRMVGLAYTMRFIPFREDMNSAEGGTQIRAASGDGGMSARPRLGYRFPRRPAGGICPAISTSGG